ncbi:UNVERIFIED_CONTAM: Transient receptor putative cation channel sub V member 6 [Siphonaria sp. JEL0065]|nr:Transient receptor putative cation channel sub V member 6 [Siphonaria sp. JEL0065]
MVGFGESDDSLLSMQPVLYAGSHRSIQSKTPQVDSSRQQSDMFLAAMDGNLEAVKLTSLQDFMDENGTVIGLRGLQERGLEGETILHIAVMMRHFEMVKWLLIQFGSGLVDDVVQTGQDQGQTALHFAVIHNDLEIVKLLVEYGASVNSPLLPPYQGNITIQTALNCAISKVSTSLEIVNYLISNDFDCADISATDSNGNTVMHSIVTHPEFEFEIFDNREYNEAATLNLVAAKPFEKHPLATLYPYLRHLNHKLTETRIATLDLMKVRNNDNLTPMQLAIFMKKPIVYADLFVHTSSQMTLIRDGNLWEAVHDGNFANVQKYSQQILTLDGAEVGRRGDYERGGEGESILHLAILRRHGQLVHWIVEEFPALVNEVFQKKKYKGESPLHLAVVKGELAIVKLLVENGAFVNSAKSYVRSEKKESVLKGGFTIELEEDVNGALDTEDERVGPVRYLNAHHLPTGTEFSQREGDGSLYYGQTVLQFATADTKPTHKKDIIRYLVENPYDPADLTHVDSKGNNVLHVLAYHGDIDIEIYKYLENKNKESIRDGKTDINISKARNKKDNFTPFQLGISRGHQSIIATMKDIRWEFGPNRQYAVEIQDIEPTQLDSDSEKRSSKCAIELAVEIRNKEVINHPIIDVILRWKWRSYARPIFMKRMIYSALFVTIFYGALAFQPGTFEARKHYFGGISQELLSELPVENGMSPTTHVISEEVDHPIPRLIMEVLSLVGAIYIMSQRFFTSRSWRIGIEYLFGLTVLAIPIVRFAVHSSSNETLLDVENVLFGLGAILGSLFLIDFAKGFEKVGPLVVIFKKVVFEDFMQWLWLFSAITVGFAAALFLQMKDAKDVEEWETYFGALVWTLRIVFAEGAFDNFRKARLPVYTYFLFFVYGFMCIVVLVNVLIAKLVETFKLVDRDSKREWKVQMASLILDIDKTLNATERKMIRRRMGISPMDSASGKSNDFTVPRHMLFYERDEHHHPTNKEIVKAVVSCDDSGKNVEFTPVGYWHQPLRDFLPFVSLHDLLEGVTEDLRVELFHENDTRHVGIKGEDNDTESLYWSRWNGKEHFRKPETMFAHKLRRRLVTFVKKQELKARKHKTGEEEV